jgi:hypothetical protein
MPILYNNILNGEEVLRSARDHELYLPNHQQFEQTFFGQYQSLIEKWSSIELSNGTILYKIRYKAQTKDVCILWGPLKNSGTSGNEHKRIQVLPITPLEDAVPYFAIGAYNAGDKHIYVVVIGGVSTFIRHAQDGSSYSSFWIDYPSLWNVYAKGEYSWSDKVGRDLLGCTEINIKLIHDAILGTLNEKSRQRESVGNVVYGTGEEGDVVALSDFSGTYSTSDSDAMPRNPLYRDIALKRENYTCEICGTTETFTDRNNNEYFEGHHLIMYNPSVQSRFRHSLDHPSNIICLCPECHRKIHRSSKEETQTLLLDLFTKHNDLLVSYGIKDLTPIINDYMNNNE